MAVNTKKVGAAGILGTITLGLVWDVYSALDNRIRQVEIEQHTTVELVKEIKEDTKYIKKILIEGNLK